MRLKVERNCRTHSRGFVYVSSFVKQTSSERLGERKRLRDGVNFELNHRRSCDKKLHSKVQSETFVTRES